MLPILGCPASGRLEPGTPSLVVHGNSRKWARRQCSCSVSGTSLVTCRDNSLINRSAKIPTLNRVGNPCCFTSRGEGGGGQRELCGARWQAVGSSAALCYAWDMARDVSIDDFGLIIAYLLPGFTAVWGSAWAAGILDWRNLLAAGPSVGSVLFTTLASVAVGLALSTLRWLVIDPLHHVTGVRAPVRNFAGLAQNVEAYAYLNDAHYRYYQHAAGMLLATVWVYAVWRWMNPDRPLGVPEVGALCAGLLYYLGSRDSLKKFYARTYELLHPHGPA